MALVRAGLPVAAIVAFVSLPGLAILASAQAGTLGFDFMSYHQVAGRAFAGEQLYDTSVQVTGGFGLFYYPPPFILIVLPFAWLDATVAAWIFTGLSVAMLVGGIWLMPVRRTVRWATLLLAGLSWPVAYALKLGQVGPILLLLFALGWRWIDRPVRFGVAGAFGALVKIQPGIVLVWAFLTRRWSAVAVGAVVGLVASLIATLTLGGTQIWMDMFTLLYNVSDPIMTPHNFTPGAAAYQAGLGEPVAIAVQAASTVLVLVAVVASAFILRAEASYLVAVVASQLLSPILWDHYAMLLLLPVAWLLERRQWWAFAIALATSTLGLFVGLPAAIYPVTLWVSLIAVFAVDWSAGRAQPPRATALA